MAGLFQFPFGNYMSDIICPECCYNLQELYNFRELCCELLEHSDHENNNNCQICCTNIENLKPLTNSPIINGISKRNSDILKELCAYDFNVSAPKISDQI